MRVSYKLFVQETMETQHTIGKLKNILAESGIEVEYDVAKKSLIFNYDTDEVQRKQTRNAGRKRKVAELHLTVKDVREMMHKKRPEEIYRTLGISKATYYRRVAQMDEKSDFEWFS